MGPSILSPSPSPDIEHPQTVPITRPESPSTIDSSDSIDTALSGLSSEITEETISPPSPSLPVEPTNTGIPQSTKQGPFTQHKRFFFEDGNITFLVDGILYRVHRYFFCRDSNIFKTRLSRLPVRETSSLPVISIENVKSQDFDAFLSILYPLDFNSLEEHSFEELSSILDLSTPIRRLNPPTPHQRLILGRKCAVDQWIPIALQELCERPQPLTPDEARLMGFEDVVLVVAVQEKVRNKRSRARIEAWRKGEPGEQPAGVPGPLPLP
ncbi:hypothetical protein BJV77DRAFT_972136 [Russula vinacea]|nr:hypothetical protein BJV77DRAFT_972136 [Russula vinacea]